MIRLLRACALLGGALLLLAALGATWVSLSWRRDFSAVPEPRLSLPTDPEAVARGAYVVNHVAHCGHCHAAEAPLLGELSGGEPIDAGPFGRFQPTNLTPHATGIGALTDGQIARAVRSAVLHDGGLAPMMVVGAGPIADADLADAIVYLRSLAPVERAVPPSEWGLLAKLLSSRFGPRAAEAPTWVPPGEPSVARGDYLANGPAACAVCHTARDPMRGFADAGPRLAGDPRPHPDPTDPEYEIVAPNLTPDPSTGVLAGWDEQRFVERFRAGRVHAGSNMPWESFAGLSEADLRSLWRYLASLAPVEHDTGPSRRPR